MRWEYIIERFEEKSKKTIFRPQKVRFNKKEKKHAFDQENRKETMISSKKKASFKMLLFSFINFLLC